MDVKSYWIKLRVLAFNQNKPTMLVTFKMNAGPYVKGFPKPLRSQLQFHSVSYFFINLTSIWSMNGLSSTMLKWTVGLKFLRAKRGSKVKRETPVVIMASFIKIPKINSQVIVMPWEIFNLELKKWRIALDLLQYTLCIWSTYEILASLSINQK